MTQAYPLHWPHGWPRTPVNKRQWSLSGGRGQGWNRVIDRLRGEIQKIGGRDVIVSTNQPLRRDGNPHAARGHIDDPGAAVYFTRDGHPFVMAQDRFELVEDNLRSLALAIEGLRQMERHGGAHMMERAFTGFAALAPPGDAGRQHWSDVLRPGTDDGVVDTLAKAETAYRTLARERHPDRGGSADQMADLNVAIAAAREVLHA